ncbi:N-acetylmuramoyl-L-alanine amidase, partial [Cellulomonas sp. Sa3CUA2]
MSRNAVAVVAFALLSAPLGAVSPAAASVSTPSPAEAAEATVQLADVVLAGRASAPAGQQPDDTVDPADLTHVVAGAPPSVGPTDRVLTAAIRTDDVQTVGMTWPEGSSAGALSVPRVRSLTDGTWSEWVDLEVADDGPDVGTADAEHAGRGGTDPVWVGDDAEAVQLSFSASVGPMATAGLRLALVGSPQTEPATGSGGIGAGRGATVPTAVGAGGIITRAEWGARSPACTPDVARTLVGGVVHHTATTNAYSSTAEVMQQLRNIQAYHIDGRGWCDIGYNFLVDKWGLAYEGRVGSLEKAVIGVHAGGFNTGTVGVSMIGTYDARPSDATLRTVGNLLRSKLGPYGVRLNGWMTYYTSGGENSRYANQNVTLPTVFGHRDVSYTACPGNGGHGALDAIRAMDPYDVQGAIRDVWAASGYGGGVLGMPVSSVIGGLRGGGRYQVFERGSVYDVPGIGASLVTTAFDAAWPTASRENGPLGYPVSGPSTSADGTVTQRFERGVVLQLPGRYPVSVADSVAAVWERVKDVLGRPVTGTLTGLRGGGMFQLFEGGGVYDVPGRGTFYVTSAFDAVWPPSSRENGPLGYPVSDPVRASDGTVSQSFETGTVVQRPGEAPRSSTSAVDRLWQSLGGASGVLGTPVSTTVPLRSGGYYQQFTRGAVYHSPVGGTRYVLPEFDAAWPTATRENGPLGYPVSDPLPLRDGGRYQSFERGAIYSSGAGTFAVSPAFDAVWPSSQRENGPLGYPTSAAVRGADGTVTQRFERGAVVQVAGGAPVSMSSAVLTAWTAAGGAGGALGAPLGGTVRGLRDGGSYQSFQRGAIYSSGAGTFAVSPAFDAVWPSSQRENGP